MGCDWGDNIMLGVVSQQLNYTLFLPLGTSLTEDLTKKTFLVQGTPIISNNAMYTGSTGVNGVSNSNSRILAFGTQDFEVGLDCNLASFGNALIDSFASAGGGGLATRGWQIYVYGDGRLSFYRLNSPSLEVITDIPVLSVNTWHNIKVRRTSGQLSIIVDGFVVKTATVSDDFQQPFCAVGYQFMDNGNGQYPTRGYIRKVYARRL